MRKAKYFYNENYFKNVTENSAYILGLIYSDGSIHKNSNRVSIALHRDDNYLLKKISSLLSNSKPLYQCKNSKCEILNIDNKIIYKDLLDIGLYNNKSGTIKPPVNYIKNRDFWRGCIDGDGSLIYFKNLRKGILNLRFYGTIDMVTGFMEFCSNYISITNAVLINDKVNKGNFASFSLSSINSYKIGKILYDNSDLYLERKYNALEEYRKELNLKKELKPTYKICQYDYQGVFIKEYLNFKDAIEKTNIKTIILSKYNIKLRPCGGFLWFSSNNIKAGETLILPKFFNIQNKSKNINYESILEMKKLHNQGVSKKEISLKYNFCQSHISKILSGKYYKNII